MAIIPVLRCRTVQDAVAFYTRTLDFSCTGSWPAVGDPAFAVLVRNGDELHLSSHAGDGVMGQAIVVLDADVEALFRRFVARGLVVANKPDSPVHRGPVAQTWGTREFYVDDPNGNTLRFVQR